MRSVVWVVCGCLLASLTGGCGCEGNAPSVELKGFKSVKLYVKEWTGTDRNEVAFGGVPLPEGGVYGGEELCLKDAVSGRRVPCQFTVLSRWPSEGKEGSIKWVLLEFPCRIGGGVERCFVLEKCVGGGKGAVDRGKVVRLERRSEGCYEVDTGKLSFVVGRGEGVMREIRVGGVRVPGRLDGVLRLEGGTVYRCVTDEVKVLRRGDYRVVMRVRGRFVDTAGVGIFGGKVKFDARIYAEADKGYVKVAFTLENWGRYGYKAVKRRGQWIYIKELALELPGKYGSVEVEGSGRIYAAPVRLFQRLHYYGEPPFSPYRIHFDPRLAKLAKEAGMAYITTVKDRFFWTVYRGDDLADAVLGRMRGEFRFAGMGCGDVRVVVKNFVQNFPAGVEVGGHGRGRVLLLPRGEYWPRSKEMAERGVYKFEGERFKTWEVVFDWEDHYRREWMEKPLFVRADTAWYRDTGAVWPLAEVGLESTKGDAALDEALRRYDRLQLAKADARYADYFEGDEFDRSRYLCPDRGRIGMLEYAFNTADSSYGWANWGDVTWAFGYCSLFYDWVYGMEVQFLRYGHPNMFYIADAMAHHRYDIDRGVGFQRYEKGYHGYDQKTWEQNLRYWGEFTARPSHTWCRGLYLWWALTGDVRALEAAEANVRAYERFWARRLKKKGVIRYREFRTQGWTIEAYLAKYEYTGEEKYLDLALRFFKRSLLGMEEANGKRGWILPGGKQSAQFESFMIVPVCRLHHLSGDEEVLGFMRRVLEWRWKEGKIGGVDTVKGYTPMRFIDLWDRVIRYDPMHRNNASAAWHMWGWMYMDAYAYLYDVTGCGEYWRRARRLFRDMLFYSLCKGRFVRRDQRFPLGYVSFSYSLNAKWHAWTTRYGQMFLWVGARRGKLRRGKGVDWRSWKHVKHVTVTGDGEEDRERTKAVIAAKKKHHTRPVRRR